MSVAAAAKWAWLLFFAILFLGKWAFAIILLDVAAFVLILWLKPRWLKYF